MKTMIKKDNQLTSKRFWQNGCWKGGFNRRTLDSGGPVCFLSWSCITVPNLYLCRVAKEFVAVCLVSMYFVDVENA